MLVPHFTENILGFYSIPWDFAQNPVILLQTLRFYSKPWILFQTLGFYSKPWDFVPNLGFYPKP